MDRSRALLDVYSRLARGDAAPLCVSDSSPAESANALRAAQLEALKRPAPFNHPFYWSAFVAVEGPQR